MKRKVLIASGCSFTNENFRSDFHHDMDCSWPKWPELLAEKLDMDYINLGHSGAGNPYIYASLMDQIVKMDPDDIGLVMPAWSQAQRKDIKVRDVWKHLDVVRNHFYSKDIAIFGDMKGRIEDSVLMYYSLQEICKSKNIPLYQFQMLGLGDGFDWVPNNKDFKYQGPADEYFTAATKSMQRVIYDNPYYNAIEDNFLGWPTYKFLGGYNFKGDVLEGDIESEKIKWEISDIDVHPNAAGQIKIAEFLYEQIK
jgi:hypothetical protein